MLPLAPSPQQFPTPHRPKKDGLKFLVTFNRKLSFGSCDVKSNTKNTCILMIAGKCSLMKAVLSLYSFLAR